MLTPFTSTEKNKQIKISISLSHPPSIAIPVLSSRLSLDQSSSRSSFYWYIDPTHHLFPWYPIRDCFFTKIKFCFRFPKIFEGVCGKSSKTTYKFLPQLPDALLEQIPRNPHNRRPDPQKSNQSSRQRKTQTAPMSCQHRKSRPSLWPNRWSEGPSGHSSRTENVTSRNARGITQSTQCLVCGRLQRRNRRSTQTAGCLKSCDIVWRSLIPHCDLWPMCWITDDVTRGRAILKSPGGFSHPLQFDLLL